PESIPPSSHCASYMNRSPRPRFTSTPTSPSRRGHSPAQRPSMPRPDATSPRAPDIAAWLRGVASLLVWSFIPFPVPLGLLRRHISAIIDERFDADGGGGMMARMLTQLPLPLPPHAAAEIAPGEGVVSGPDGGGVVWVHGLATFAWDAGDEAARRLAAVQLVQLNAATQVQVAQAFGVIPV